MHEVKRRMQLSVTEPNNGIGVVKVRQDDRSTPIFSAEIVANGELQSFSGLTPFFVNRTKFDEGQPIEQHERMQVYESACRVEYTLDEQDMQWIGRNTAYFSFRQLNSDGTYDEAFSTRDFDYYVLQGITKGKIHDSGYVWTYEELLRLFKDGIINAGNEWEIWVEANKDIIESIDPSGALLAEIIDARGDYDSLADRLNAPVEVNVDKTIGGASYQTPTPKNIKNVRNKIDTSKFNIGFSTDLHAEFHAPGGIGREAGYVSFKHVRNIQSLSDILDGIVFGGDNIDGYYSNKQHAIKANQRFANMLLNQPIPNIPLVGNHDGGMIPNAVDGRGPDDSLTSTEVAKLYGYERNAYTFTDFEEKKIRVITLDTNDFNEKVSNGKYLYHTGDGQGFALQEQQLEFLYDSLLSTPTDYHVMIFAHAPLSVSGEDQMLNNDLLRTLMRGFKDGISVDLSSSVEGHEVFFTADFTSRGTGVLVGYFAGHWHAQGMYDSNGICKEVVSDTAGLSKDHLDNVDTENEDSFSVFEVDTENRTCKTYGVGRTTDVSFSY